MGSRDFFVFLGPDLAFSISGRVLGGARRASFSAPFYAVWISDWDIGEKSYANSIRGLRLYMSER